MVKNKKGFTLVELVIVIAVVVILAGVLPTFANVIESSRESSRYQRAVSAEKEVLANYYSQSPDDMDGLIFKAEGHYYLVVKGEGLFERKDIKVQDYFRNQ